jgi:alpha-L-rhamnosidase
MKFYSISICLLLGAVACLQGEGKDWQKYVLTPKAKQCYALNVHSCGGQIENADHILKNDGASTRLTWTKAGKKPYILLDLGPASPGGYPVFKVTANTGRPVLRISYADWYDFIAHPTYAETGDFNRGTCTYLGVELPVPPGNPYRYELYTITEPGEYFAAMIQGQQRWVRIQLDTEDTSVDLDYFYIEFTSDRSPYAGHFLCSDEDLNRLWYASTYTAQISSFPNSNAWEIINGWLAPRQLAKSNSVGLLKKGREWKDYEFEFDFKILNNPGPASAVGWAFRCQDENNGYVAQIDLCDRFSIAKRSNGVLTPLKDPVLLPVKMVDGVKHHLKTTATGKTLRTFLDGRLIDTSEDATFAQGRIGFYQPLDKWSLIDNVVVTSHGKTMFADDFSTNLEPWQFTRTLSCLVDGAKRDRLPWIGDLDWAGRNVYYAFADGKYMMESLKMFAFNQTPEGFIWATCYPENTRTPAIGEYGYYQSDEFSAWFVPTLADYLLFTADTNSVGELYEPMKRDLDYLWSHVEGDGLHFTRYETSKGIWGHVLGQTGKGSYVNLLIHDAMNEGAFVAENLGKIKDAETFRNRAAVMKQAINKKFWNEEKGWYNDKIGGANFLFEANAMALATGFPDKTKVPVIVKNLESHWHGKFQSLAIRGKFQYGYDDDALGRIRRPGGRVNWIDPLHDWRGPHTTWECMTYPLDGSTSGSAWGDLSHTDTAMAHQLSGFILGIQPDAIGYARFHAVPHPCDLRWAEGTVPTPHGEIQFFWKISNGLFSEKLVSPQGTKATVGVPRSMVKNGNRILINETTVIDSQGTFIPQKGISGQHQDELYFYFDGLEAGEYVVEVK